MLLEPKLRYNLLTLAERYAGHSGLQITTVARRFCGDDRFFERLADGKTFTVLQYDRVAARFSEQWPEKLRWPAKVPRPNKSHIQEAQKRAPTSRAKSWN